MRRFVIVGRTARASEAIRLDDLAGTSGRLDVLLRCVRAALLTSNGVRRDAVIYLVLMGDALGTRTVRIEGATARFLRPDERPLATLVQKAVARARGDAAGFVPQRNGLAVACGGLEAAIDDIGASASFLLEEGAPDVRDVPDTALAGDVTFFVGDHLGYEDVIRERLAAHGARPLGVGPVSLHSDDVVAIVSNEIDRRGAAK